VNQYLLIVLQLIVNASLEASSQLWMLKLGVEYRHQLGCFLMQIFRYVSGVQLAVKVAQAPAGFQSGGQIA
jgi:hypothetical protein